MVVNNPYIIRPYLFGGFGIGRITLDFHGLCLKTDCRIPYFPLYCLFNRDPKKTVYYSVHIPAKGIHPLYTLNNQRGPFIPPLESPPRNFCSYRYHSHLWNHTIHSSLEGHYSTNLQRHLEKCCCHGTLSCCIQKMEHISM